MRWSNVREHVRERLAALTASRHESEFLRDSRTWSRSMREDFFGRTGVEPGPALAIAAMLERLYRMADVDMKALAMAGPGGYAVDQIAALAGPGTYLMPDFSLFQNELRGYNEVVRWPLYSTKSYPTGGTAQLTFFDQSEGLATNGRADTNMQAAGQLPGNQMHVAHSLRIIPIPPKASFSALTVVGAFAAAEVLDILTNLSWAEITVSDKLYMIGAPLTLFPAGQGVGTFVNNPAIVTANSFANANNGHPSNEAIYRLNPPLGILPTRTFLVTNNWKGTPPTVTNAIRVMNNLDGWRLRAVQ